MNQLQGKIHFDVKMGRRDGKILENHFVGLALRKLFDITDPVFISFQ